jgi:serine/threonine protein phosphatase 1
MRTLAVGDIHGCFTALAALMEAVAIQPDDCLITLGDYIDRGPDSRAVVEWLMRWQTKGRLIALRGNHEAMLLAARLDRPHFDEWLACGGREALASYTLLPGVGDLADIPDEHWRFIENTQLWWETKTHFFVHANVYPDLPLAEQPEYMLLWEKFDDPAPHESGKTMICGHTPQKLGRPRSVGHAVCIDTWVYRGGWLTCLDVDSGRYWQANQRGEIREGMLDEI